MLGEGELGLLKVMADGRLYTLSALAVPIRRDHKVAGRLLKPLVEQKLVEALELRRADWKRGELGSVKVYRITPEGLKAISAQSAREENAQPPSVQPRSTAPAGSAPAVGEPAQAAAEARMRAWDLLFLRIISDGALWGINALLLALARIIGGYARSSDRRKIVARHLRRLIERGEVEALELRTAAQAHRGFTVTRVYRITGKGLEALEREPSAPLPSQLKQRAQQSAKTDQRTLELLRAMNDRALYSLNALVEATGWHWKTVKKYLARLIERGEVEAVELRRACWKRREIETQRAYRITTEGLRAIGVLGAAQPPAAQSGSGAAPASAASSEPARGGSAGKVDWTEAWLRARDLLLLRMMSDGAAWGLGALCFAVARAASGGAHLRINDKIVARHLRRLIERGEVEALELRTARRQGGLAALHVYRITGKGLEALEREPQQFELLALPPRQYNPAELLKVMEDGGFWTARALAKATGWHRKTVSRYLRRLEKQGLVEAVEVHKVSRARKAILTERVYRLKRESSTVAARSGGNAGPRAGGRPDLDILWTLSDGALWSVSALRAATRYRVVRWHLKWLVKLNLAEAVEVRVARRRGSGLATARFYQITERGLKVLESGEPPPPAPPALLRGRVEPPESGDPVQLAIWVVEWSVIATRILLHLHSQLNSEDSWYGVAVAASGYRLPLRDRTLGPILLRLRELGLVKWQYLPSERTTHLPGRPKRVVHLTEKGREVADAIIKLVALFAEESGKTFL
jgi:predicted ArsR family transcriptional regulator